MTKRRKRPRGRGPGQEVPPPPDEFWGMLPHPSGFPGHPPHAGGPRIPGEPFPEGPPEYGPPPHSRGPFMHPPEFEGAPGFHPPEFGGAPGFHPPEFGGAPGFHPPEFEGAPGFHPPEFEGAPGFHPPEFEGAPGFHPPEFEGPRRFPPEFEDRPRSFYPPEFEDGHPYPHSDFECRPPHNRPPGFEYGPEPGFYPRPHEHGPSFHPAELEERVPGFGPPGHRPSGFEYPVMDRGCDPLDRFGAVDKDYRLPVEVQVTAPPLPATPGPPPGTQSTTNQQAFKQPNNENPEATSSKSVISTVKNASRSVKPPPGRSKGVISFIGNNYGFIEREDLRKFTFPFDAYFGNRAHLVPGVKVHFTALKVMGKECATDVKVAPGGTEEIEATVYEGVVIKVLPDAYVGDPHPGCIRTILSTDPIKLSFGKPDTRATLLMYDRVKFQLLTDIITKANRATNITPQIPETFQLTKETREKGVILNLKDDTYSILAKKHDGLSASVNENLSDVELNVMDEVEFTLMTVKDTVKAIRLKKLSDGSVVFDSQDKDKTAAKEKTTGIFSDKDKWKPVTSETGVCDEEVMEEISIEKYEGTIVQVIPKQSMKERKEGEEQKGLLEFTVADTKKRLNFKSGDVITKATMMDGDQVNFNISINSKTKEEHAVNIEIQTDSFHVDSTEQRKIGVVVQLGDNSGFIKTPLEPQLYFDLSEVMEATNLSLSEKVVFTLAENDGAEEGKRAIRIMRLTESVFTAVPKLEALREKEKKKMTIKLMRDPKKQIKNEVKTDVKKAGKPEKDKSETSTDVKPPKVQKQDVKSKQENGKVDVERNRSQEHDRHRSSRSRNHSQDTSGRNHRSSSRERSNSRYRRSRSHSRDRTHSYRQSYSRYRSRSRSKDRSSRSGRRRSHSPEYRHDRHKGPRSSKERSCRRRSRTPEKKAEGSQSLPKSEAGSSSYENLSISDGVDDELLRKRKELLDLNELIARKRAIIAMKQPPKSFKGVLEMDREHGYATFDYQHKTCVESTWVPDMKPAKSILKKHTDPLSQHQSSERCLSPEEPAYPTNSTANSNACSASAWVNPSILDETEDEEIARKKRQIEELSESIARKRAIAAMEQKVKVISDGPDIKKEYNLCSDDLEISAPTKNTWQLDLKPDIQPKKSILKKRSEPLADQPQREMTSAELHHYGHSLFPICEPRQDFSKPSGLSHTTVEKSTNLPNTFDVFKRLIKDVSTNSRTGESSQSGQSPPLNDSPGQRSFSAGSNPGLFFGQRSTEAAKSICSYEDTSLTSSCQSQQSSQQAPAQSSISDSLSDKPSTSEQKRNVATQMQRFLSALNKADSNVLSSMLLEAQKDSMERQKSPQVQVERNVHHRDELYDPFKETEDNDSFLMETKRSGNLALGHIGNRLEDHGGDDLLPHERALQEGSGFSKIVWMKYGTEATADNPFLYEEKKSQSRISEEQKRFSDHEPYELHQDHYNDFERQSSVEGCENMYSHVLDSAKGTDGKNICEDVATKTEQFEKIQNLLQTIGLTLDTAEVSKLADRTKERLYGKKIKPQSASSYSSDLKDEPSTSRYDGRRSRTDSSDSEGVCSVSPVRSSNREVYMSYLDSVKYRDHRGEAAVVKERELLNLKRTIKNNPVAQEVTPDPYKQSMKVTHDSDDTKTERTSTLAQTISTLYKPRTTESSSATSYLTRQQNSWLSFYNLEHDPKKKKKKKKKNKPNQNNSQDPVSPYSSFPPSPLPYPSGIQIPPPQIPPPQIPPPHVPPPHVPPPHVPPPGYGTFPAPHFALPPPFTTPTLFAPPPTPMYPPPVGQFAMPMQPGGYVTNQAKTKSAASTRCLKTIQTLITPEPDIAKPVLSNVHRTLISIQTVRQAEPKVTEVEDESKQAASITEDDIKAKQKKRLEQFNQRMRLKKEQQMEAQRTHGQSQKSAPGKVTRNEVKNVWICGHSLVFWAEKRTTSPEIGMQLGMDPNSVRIWWKGVQGMTWQQLLPQLLQLKDNWPRPDVIILHLGGNDIGKTATEAFLAAVKEDLISVKSIFPDCLLVWSEILPRRSWRHSNDSVAVDIMRKAINESICDIMAELGGSSLSHENIKPGLDTGLYRPDGVHLSGKGIDTFNLNMQDFLENWEGEMNETEPFDI